MAYVDEDYYFVDFDGSILDNDAEEYLALAQEKIDSITFNRIVKIGFDNLTEFQKDKISKAICYEAEHIFKNGYNNEDTDDISSYSVLDISVSVKDKEPSEKTEAQKENMCEKAYDFVKKTGLTNRSFRF